MPVAARAGLPVILQVAGPMGQDRSIADVWSAMGGELREKMFRFDDRQTGRLLAIPPDITPQIARIVATRMHGYPLPHRICYNGRVLRHAEVQSGRSREIFQSGVELIGLSSPEADAEMVAMAVEALKQGAASYVPKLQIPEMLIGTVDEVLRVAALNGAFLPALVGGSSPISAPEKFNTRAT